MPNRNAGPGRSRLHPRISATKLGEYMEVAVRRRETIVRDQKHPPEVKTARYRDAFVAIRASLLSGGDLERSLLEKAKLIEAKLATTSYQSIAKDCCAEGVRGFARLVSQLPADLVATAPWGQTLTLTIEGVTVSVAPVVMLERVTAGTKQRGALVVVLAKGNAPSKRSCEVVGELLRQALELSGMENVSRELCLVADPFRRRLFDAPRARKRLNEEIESACREIAARWSAAA